MALGPAGPLRWHLGLEREGHVPQHCAAAFHRPGPGLRADHPGRRHLPTGLHGQRGRLAREHLPPGGGGYPIVSGSLLDLVNPYFSACSTPSS